jgi:hypothetical protein
MKNLLDKSGIAFDTKTEDETYIMLRAINLLEKKLTG